MHDLPFQIHLCERRDRNISVSAQRRRKCNVSLAKRTTRGKIKFFPTVLATRMHDYPGRNNNRARILSPRIALRLLRLHQFPGHPGSKRELKDNLYLNFVSLRLFNPKEIQLERSFAAAKSLIIHPWVAPLLQPTRKEYFSRRYPIHLYRIHRGGGRIHKEEALLLLLPSNRERIERERVGPCIRCTRIN